MRFVVVGNGIAGMSAAYAIRGLNNQAEIKIISEERHPTYSPCLLPHYLSGEIGREKVFVRKLPDYLSENIQLITSERATALDPDRKEITLQTENIAYDKLIVSTGSKAILPPISGTDKEGVFTFKSIEDGERILSWKGYTAVVIGSGPIGIEASLALKTRGYRVFVIELLDRILPQIFDEYSSRLIEDVLKNVGIEVGTHEKVTEISGEEKVKGIVTDRRKVECDTVILATGMRPEKSLVEGILELGSLGGIKVDNKMATSLEDVYACGDCVEAQSLIDGRPTSSLLWHNARQQGEIAGSNATGFSKIYPGSLNVAGLEVAGLRAVSIGSTEASLNSDVEIIELRRNRGYRRLVLSKGVLVGVQSIDWDIDIGLLLATIIRKERVKTYDHLISSRKPWPRFFTQFSLGRKLNREAMVEGEKRVHL